MECGMEKRKSRLTNFLGGDGKCHVRYLLFSGNLCWFFLYLATLACGRLMELGAKLH